MANGKYKLQLAVIVGASHVLKYKAEHPNATDEEALGYVTKNASEILRKIEEDGEF